MSPIHFTPIAILHAPYRDKFGVPRQSGLVTGLPATIELLPPYNRPEAVTGLEPFSHLWIQFLFHLNPATPWQPMVRPPRLGGNRKIGVFASRAPFRPNPIGLSAVRILAIHAAPDDVRIEIDGADLVDGTPILDLKPYIPYSDAIPNASGGFAPHPPQPQLCVHFAPQAQAQLTPQLETQLRHLLELDPRPAYHANQPRQRSYAMRLYHYEIKWKVDEGVATVLEISSNAGG